jgi:hypothetical protein
VKQRDTVAREIPSLSAMAFWFTLGMAGISIFVDRPEQHDHPDAAWQVTE